jgi:TPR repeat protein
MIAVPVRIGGEVVGLLEVFSPHPDAFHSKDDNVLQRISEVIASSVSRAARLAVRNADQLQATDDIPANLASFDTPELVSRSRSQKIILIASAITLTIALVWLVSPSVRNSLAGRNSSSLHLQTALVSPANRASSSDSISLEGMRRLAEQGDAAAQYAVGVHYATGQDVPQDYSEALRWFSKAADQGHVSAQAVLGAYYWAGRGTSQNFSKAYFWALLAQAGGDEASKERVTLLASRLSRAQIVAEQQAANDWIMQHPAIAKSRDTH